MPAETAKLLAMQTVYGAASLAAESREDPGVLRQQVTSPNGTTAAALAVLMGEDRLTSCSPKRWRRRGCGRSNWGSSGGFADYARSVCEKSLPL